MLLLRSLLLYGTLFAALGHGLPAQQESVNTTNSALAELEGVRVPPDQGEPPVGPASATADYPLRVTLISGHTRYVGNHFYKGRGSLILGGDTRKFKYGCPYALTFAHANYASRWRKSARNLQVLTTRPHGSGSSWCVLEVAAK